MGAPCERGGSNCYESKSDPRLGGGATAHHAEMGDETTPDGALPMGTPGLGMGTNWVEKPGASTHSLVGPIFANEKR